MNPPSVLLDRSFLDAVANPRDGNHGDAVATYRSLLDDFVAQRCLIVARADHLVGVGMPDLFAAVGKLHVARQHVSAATKVRGVGVDPDLSITLVLLHRLRIRTVASFDARLADYDVKMLPSASVGGGERQDAAAATELAPG